MSLIESYDIEEGGFHPFLIRDSWQVAKLNYKKEYHIDHIDSFKTHKKSDKGLALLKGNAMLITNDNAAKNTIVNVVLMEIGTSYNIPKNVSYAIAMEEGSEIFIVEKNNMHIEDTEQYILNEEEQKAIKLSVTKELNKAE